MPRRTGATMIEVLVAIFIMGIGLMALLTLFPLGALRMADAIQKERTAQAGVNATSIAELRRLRTDPVVTAAMMSAPGVGPITNTEGRSHPVFVDPVGVLTTGGAAALGGTFVAGTPLLPRVLPSFVNDINLPLIRVNSLRWFSLHDDIAFDNVTNFGYPKVVVAPLIERDYRFTWAYLVQRPRAADATVVDTAVVVYAGRGMSLTGNLTLPEYRYDNYDPKASVSEVTYFLTSPPNTVRIRYEYFNNVLPQIRAGNWILDLSNVKGEVHAYFYRVTGVTEGIEPALGNAAYVDLEVQQTFRGFTAATGDPFIGPSAGNLNDRARVIILENVVEVFERGAGKGP